MENDQRFVRVMTPDVEVDVENRILKRAVVMTRNIASDGGIIMPEGINAKFFESNPVVLLMHGFTAEFPVVGRALNVAVTRDGMEASVQFADTILGRDIAYLYGVNADAATYARGWSFGWDTMERETWTLDEARQWLGSDYDDDLVPAFVKRHREVWVAKKTMMNEFSAVALGADRKALSRAYSERGIRLAGELVTEMDLGEARRDLAELKKEREADARKIAHLERDVQALLSDDASAARQRDSEAVLREIRDITKNIRGTTKSA